MFRSVALMALLAGSSVSTAAAMRADSTVGRALLRSATVEQEARSLQNYNYYNQGQNQNGERDASFLASYYIKYLGCSSTVTYDQEENGGDGNPLITSNLVKFTLCADSCSSCSGGGLYVVGMEEFIMAYNEMKMDEKEYKCEMQRESCNYNQNCNYDDQYCEQMCFKEAGMEECIEYEGQEEFELDRYLECGQVEMNNNQNGNGNNNNNNNQNQNNNQNNYNDAAYWYEYFMGPYCHSDGKSIMMRLYYDDGCTIPAPDNNVFYKRTGMEMPYGSSSIVSKDECFSCEDPEQQREYEQQQWENNYNGNNQNNNNNGNWYYEMEPSELCQQSYERAARCETGMNVAYPDETGCTFINEYLPKLEGASKSFMKTTGSSSSKTAVVFAWVFGLTTALFGAYAYFLYRKIKRGAVNLSSQDGALA